MRKKVKKSTKHRLFILIPVTFVVMGYFLISFSFYIYKIYSLKKEEKILIERLETLKDEEDNLQTDIEKFQNPDYLARYARENYHYSKEGELVIQTKKQEKEEGEKKEIEKRPSYTIFFLGGFALFLIVVYLFFHNTKKR